MNTGQTLISIAAMALLSTTILNVNRNSLTTTLSITETKYKILAVSLANTIIEEASSKSFDEKTTDNNLVTNVSELSTTLKADAGETLRKQFDDFDDFHKFEETTDADSTYDYATMNISCTVKYVDPFVSLDSVNYNTWHKRITVTVSSPYFEEGTENITLSKIISHYYFR
ncbi:MAG: hypothetical protein IPM32_06295 [Ignavibacteriae bacterium]|nr:hypothetical protein [Ignavibacteriota bacterium]